LPACYCQPAVAGGVIYADLWGELSTHLALQSLFAQISPVREPLLQLSPFQALGKVTLHLHSQACVFIYSSCGRWVFPPLLCSSPPTSAFKSFPAPDYWAVLLLLPAAMFIYSSRGKWVFPPLLWSFPPSTTLTSFPPPGCWAHAPAPARGSPAHPASLFTVPGRIPFPQSSVLSVPHPLPCVSCSCCLLLSFSVFFQVEVSLSRGLCCSGPGLSVGVPWYCKAHLVHVFPSRLGASDWRPGGPSGFSFNMKWRFSAPAGGVEGSMFCLFSVIMPAKCVSSVSPRFYYRRLAFCFLPLATILESPGGYSLIG
jgi:hypothetical protein